MEDVHVGASYRQHLQYAYMRDATVNQSALAESPSSHTTFPEYTPPPAAPNKNSVSLRASRLPATNLKPFFAEAYGDDQDMLGGVQDRGARSSVLEFRRMVEEDARSTRGGYMKPNAVSNGNPINVPAKPYDVSENVRDVAPLGRAPMTYAAMENLSYGTSGIQSIVSPVLTNETQPPRMAPVMDDNNSELYEDYSTSPAPNTRPQYEENEDAGLRHPSRSTAAFPNTYSHSPSSGTMSPSPNATREKYNTILGEVRQLCELNNATQQERIYWEETLKGKEMQWSYDRERLQNDLSDTDAERRFLRTAVEGLRCQMQCLEMNSSAMEVSPSTAAHRSAVPPMITSNATEQNAGNGDSATSGQPRLDGVPGSSNAPSNHSNSNDIARVAIHLLRIICEQLGDAENGALSLLRAITKEDSQPSHLRPKRTSPSRYISPSSNDIHNPHYDPINPSSHQRNGKKDSLESKSPALLGGADGRVSQRDPLTAAQHCGVKLGAILNKMEYWIIADQREKPQDEVSKEELSRSAEACARDFVSSWSQALERAAATINTDRHSSSSSHSATRTPPAAARRNYEMTTAEEWHGENGNVSDRGSRAHVESDGSDMDEDALLLLSEQMQQVKSDAFLREEQLLKRINVLEEANQGLARQRSMLEEENVELLAQLKAFDIQPSTASGSRKERQMALQTFHEPPHARARGSRKELQTASTINSRESAGMVQPSSSVARSATGIVAMPGLLTQDMEALEANYMHLCKENEKLVRYVVAMEERVRKLDTEKQNADNTVATLKERVQRYALALQISADRGPQPLKYTS